MILDTGNSSCKIKERRDAKNVVKGQGTARWNPQAAEHKGYTDLSDYVIDLGTVDQEEYEKGIQLINERGDDFATPMCTAAVNCAQKYLKVRFWERQGTIYEYRWE